MLLSLPHCKIKTVGASYLHKFNYALGWKRGVSIPSRKRDRRGGYRGIPRPRSLLGSRTKGNCRSSLWPCTRGLWLLVTFAKAECTRGGLWDISGRFSTTRKLCDLKMSRKEHLGVYKDGLLQVLCYAKVQHSMGSKQTNSTINIGSTSDHGSFYPTRLAMLANLRPTHEPDNNMFN